MLRALRSTTRDRLRPTVQQLIADVVSDAAGQPLAGPDHIAAAAEDLLSHIGGMAPHLGTGMAALTLSFDGYCTGRGAGRRFHELDLQTRRACFNDWRKLPGPLKSWTLFYEKMGTFSYWAVVEDMEHGHSGSAERGSNA